MLTERLKAIIECVDETDVVADVGCDHGYVSKALIDQRRAHKVIACDISAPSLAKAVTLIHRAGLVGRIETRLGSGLTVLHEGEASTIILAGMGGMLMQEILAEHASVAQSARLLVLSPHKNEAELRQYLLHNGYDIVSEKLVRDEKRFYQIMCAAPGKGNAEEDPFYFQIGRRLLEQHDENLPAFLRSKIAAIRGVIKQAQKGSETGAYLESLEKLQKRMEEVLRCNCNRQPG